MLIIEKERMKDKQKDFEILIHPPSIMSLLEKHHFFFVRTNSKPLRRSDAVMK
jgi:hypothetical protein